MRVPGRVVPRGVVVPREGAAAEGVAGIIREGGLTVTLTPSPVRRAVPVLVGRRGDPIAIPAVHVVVVRVGVIGGRRVLLRLLGELFLKEIHKLHGLGREGGEIIVVVGHCGRKRLSFVPLLVEGEGNMVVYC